MKKNIVPIVLIVIGIILMGFGIFTVFLTPEKKEYPKKIEGYDVKEFDTLETCLDENCEYKQTDLYADISFDYDSDVLQNAIKKLNESTKKYYNMAKNSTVDTTTCVTPSANQNSIRISSDYNVYSDGKVITLNIKRTQLNICTNETESYQSENYVYNLETDKMLNLKETMEKLNITNKDINEAIKNSNDSLSQAYQVPINTKDNYADIKIYYNTAGDLYVSYYVDELNEYMSALLRERES